MFKLKAPFKETPAQKEAIEKLVKNLRTKQKHHVLLGVTGSGKSLDFFEPIFVIEGGGEGKLLPIGELIEKELKSTKNKSQKEETIIISPTKKYQVISLNPNTFKVEVKPVVSLIRHRAPKEMFHLKTGCGRSAIITGDHNFYVLRAGKLKLLSTKEIKPGDYLPLPQKLFYPNKKISKINLLDFFENEKLSVKGKILQSLLKKYGRKRINHFLKKDFKSPENKTYAILKNIKGSSLPLNIFKELLKKLKLPLNSRILKNISIFPFRRASKKVCALRGELKINSSILKILGYYLAEGQSQKNYLTISNTEPLVQKEINSALKKLKWPFRMRENKDTVVHGSIYCTFLEKLCGSRAGNKKLPYFWPNLSQKQLSVLLQTYFEGDGWVERERVLTVTKSKQLASDLSYALSRWGIWTRIRKIKKRAFNSNQRLTTYWEVSISGQENLRLFAKNIGFRSSEKNKQLREQLKHKPHSNVDIIPGCGNLLREIRKSLHLYTTQLGKRANLTHSIISMFESSKRNPTRKTLLKLIKVFKERVKEMEELNLEYLKFWSELTPVDLEKAKEELLHLLKINRCSTSFSEVFKISPFSSLKRFNGEPSPATKLINEMSLLLKNFKKEKINFPNPLNGFVEHPFKKRGEILLRIIKTLNLPLPNCKINPRMQFETLQKLSFQYYQFINSALQKAKENIKNLEMLLSVRWTPVKPITKIPYRRKYVYDIAVKDNETFLAGFGGLFAHNTFMAAKVIEKIQKPILWIAPNKTLVAQAYQEFKEFFPKNSVHFFCSYYDYYQPEAYIPETDTYIEKDAKINEEIDRLRHAAVQDVLTRSDVIVCASVSCIYNIGSPEDYQKVALEIKPGKRIRRKNFLAHLTSLGYQRNDYEFSPSTFRVRGNAIDIFLVTGKEILRVEFFGDYISRIYTNMTTNFTNDYSRIFVPKFVEIREVNLYPAHFWVTPQERLKIALENIRLELQERVKELKKQNKLVEAQRLEQRTNYDLEMIEETGYCHGIENYSRHLEFRKSGEPPWTLLDYFQEDPLIFIDESHLTIPQLRAMANQDRSRKESLIEYGFRLPSCIDNRPLTFEEFNKKVKKLIYVSATPDEYERKKAGKEFIVEQLIRPTGLLEPSIEVRPTKNQVKDLIEEIKKRAEKGQRTLVLTLTKRLAEALADYLKEEGISCQWLHSEVKTLERPQILKELREGKYDVLVGINLLREGLDLPEVALIAILDADKEGFLRSATTLIQVMGRAARHPEGHCILYADKITRSMKEAIKEIERRRKIQMEYNKKYGILPKPIVKPIREWLFAKKEKEIEAEFWIIKDEKLLEREMRKAAKNLDFERAAQIRDLIKKIKNATKYEYTKK